MLDTIPAGAVIELDRTLDEGGSALLAGERTKIGAELARQKVALRLDGHLLHVVHNGVLAKTLAAPVALEQRQRLKGARIATTQLPPPAAGPVSVQTPRSP
ncbi:hypothetical protein GTY80_31355 [Amycolatopsis sp. SID8362]|nr:hypothetical protein [Amycolatopsis sp. SID8362]NED44414.1 hypothetical protein [Amycolatopsis sp. SID8362]